MHMNQTNAMLFTTTIKSTEVSLRALLADGAPWLCAADVCEALGYARPQQLVRAHVAPADQRTIEGELYVNDDGAFSIGKKCPRKSLARTFQLWLLDVVLPGLEPTVEVPAEPAEPTNNEQLASQD